MAENKTVTYIHEISTQTTSRIDSIYMHVILMLHNCNYKTPKTMQNCEITVINH